VHVIATAAKQLGYP